MTPEIMWSVLVTMGAITIGAVIKAVEFVSELKLVNKELSRSSVETDSLKKQHNQAISDMQSLNMAEKEKLTDRISNLEKQLHVFTSGEREAEVNRLASERRLVDRLNDEIIP